MKLPDHKTKIVCTIGPASTSRGTMEQMLLAGMNVARLNFSHGDLSAHKGVIENLRAASRDTGRRLAIMGDLSGPKMRIGSFQEEPIELHPGDPFVLTTAEIVGDQGRVSVSFKRLPQAVKPGDALYLNDGTIQVEVDSVQGEEVSCTVVVGGELRSRKGLNLPGIDLGISAFTERDHECLRFAAEQGIDAVSQSFVESGDDIRAVRKAAEALNYHPFIIAKIERSNALENMEDILDASDGIMIARGDLGVEVPIEQIAVIQKDLMRLANRRAKPVITATQMLESMTENRRPTRAEATDVANAILDGTDCVMLSAESAMGRYPVDAVAMLASIAAAVEPRRNPVKVRELFKGVELKGALKPAHLIAVAVEASYRYASSAAVFVPTRSGATARSLSLFRMPVWITAVSSSELTCRNLSFSYGVYPVYESEHPEDWERYVTKWMESHEMKEELAIVTEGPSRRHPEAHNRMEIIDLRGNREG
ncbi:pyruvate kinase [Geomonas sp. RF6]|uniref:pyruvate kinase n=1 Tax=Geomonas sp. RF6 TaxID=2897342 RepID=UPI001E5D2530|nr:pyruvate kinase [Geomonas sp. RF6]UFS70645.1 pyruvate kinase [Geomonas sp. RF6]